MQSLWVESASYLMRIILVTFFSVGYTLYYERFYHNNVLPGGHRASRVGLFFVPLIFVMILHFGGLYVMRGSAGVFYHDPALYLLITPFFYPAFSKLEVGGQVFVLTWFWCATHPSNVWQPLVVIGYLILIGLITIIKRHGRWLVINWGAGVLIATAVAIIFWVTVPNDPRLPVTVTMRIWFIVVYALMCTMVLGIWARQMREAEAKAKFDQVANYEVDGGTATFMHQAQELSTLFEQATTTGADLTLASLDVDQFKQVNAHYGHLAGNTVLLGITETINQVLLHTVTPAWLLRTNGEEFTIVFPKTSIQAALPVIQQVREAIQTSEYTYHDRGLAVTASIGVTNLLPTDTSVDDLYARADDAMYLSKHHGRNCVSTDEQVINAPTEAKDYSQYRYFVQGVYDISQSDPNRIYSELLLRKYDEDLKRFVRPDDFELPANEMIRLIQQLMTVTPIHNFNLNLTASQYQDAHTAEALQAFANQLDGPDHLTIEVTDVVATAGTRQISAGYRAAGMNLLIDDVGSDNSYELVHGKFAYVEGVKFALQNLRRTTKPDELLERVGFWQKTAADNGLLFILEGVETADDLQQAKQMGIRYVQGYYFDKPTDPTPNASGN